MKLKILAFDGEMLPTMAAMPNPEKSPIMLISFAANYNIMNEKKKVVFILNRTKDIQESVKVFDDKVEVRFSDETRMIHGWELLVKECDVLSGYNSSGFDIPYIVDRAKALNMRKLSIGGSDDNLWYRKSIKKGISIATIGGVKGKIIFDVLYLLKRADESNTLKKEFKFKNDKLESTAPIALGKEKKDFSIKEMIDYWENGTNEEKFINYCSVDSELALEFITKFRLLDKFIMLSIESGKLTQDIVDSQGFGNLVENLLAKKFVPIGRVLPCRGQSFGEPVDAEEEDELAGAFVKEPKLGITDNIASGDYTSLYPTLMRRGNICPTTVILDNTIPDNDNMIVIENDEGALMGRFIKPSILKGIIPSVQEELMTKRALLKTEMKKHDKGTTAYLMLDAQQNATKILLNTFYGFTGEQGNKVYCYNVAASVTGSGRKQIKYTMGMIEGKSVSYNGKNYKLTVIAGDTDSVYVQVIPEDLTEKLNRESVVAITTIKFNEINATLEKPMKLAFENYVKRMLVTAKKRYAMLTIDDKGKKSIVKKGIESVRRDWCDFSTDAQENVIDILLNEEDVNIATKKVIDYIRDEADKLRDGKIDIQKIILSKKLTKPITSYDNDAIHVKVAIKMKERGHPSEVGDRIQYLIIDNDKKLVGDKAEEAEYVISGQCNYKIDYNYYIDKQLNPPVGRILDVIGSNKDLLKVDKKQKTMMDF